MTNHQRLDQFDSKNGLDRGKPRWIELIWYLMKCFFFLSALPWSSRLKCWLLRLFGAKIGKGVVIKPRVNIHFPWKLNIGDFCWIGEEVFILNFEPITIGSHSCISQRSFLCGGNHDYKDCTFAYRNAPVNVGEGVWIGAQCFVGPGVTIHDFAVATAGSIVVQDLPREMICSGNPCLPRKPRWRSAEPNVSSSSIA